MITAERKKETAALVTSESGRCDLDRQAAQKGPDARRANLEEGGVVLYASLMKGEQQRRRWAFFSSLDARRAKLEEGGVVLYAAQTRGEQQRRRWAFLSSLPGSGEKISQGVPQYTGSRNVCLVDPGVGAALTKIFLEGA